MQNRCDKKCGGACGGRLTSRVYSSRVLNEIPICVEKKHSFVSCEGNVRENKVPSLTTAAPRYREIKIGSAYLGMVTLRVLNFPSLNSDQVVLCTDVGPSKPIQVRVLDAQQSQLSFLNTDYAISDLLRCSVAVVSWTRCNQNWSTIERLRAKGQFTPREAKQLMDALIENNFVDVFFGACEEIKQIQSLGLVNPSNVSISVANIPSYDNAFLSSTGYMVYGNGRNLFSPMGAIDVCGHELGHAWVQLLSGLVYQGESGALNEGFADMFGAALEHYAYKEYNKDKNPFNDLKGEFDWDIGEDVGKAMPKLRSMSDPKSCNQPDTYHGALWVDSSNLHDGDYGGVHTNSGVFNKFFYLLATSVYKGDVQSATKQMVEVLKILPSNATYLTFRDACKKVLGETCYPLLLQVGLDDTAPAVPPPKDPSFVTKAALIGGLCLIGVGVGRMMSGKKRGAKETDDTFSKRKRGRKTKEAEPKDTKNT